MGMETEFRCGRRICVEVIEKHERLDQFTDVARTDQSGKGPMRASTRAQINLPGSLLRTYLTRERCIGLHCRSPEIWLSVSFNDQPLIRPSKDTRSSRRR